MNYPQLRNNGGFFPSWDEEKTVAPDLIDVISDLDFEGSIQEKCKDRVSEILEKGVQVDDKGREILTDHEFSKHKMLLKIPIHA